MKGMPTKLSAVGVLLGTLAAIGNGDWGFSWVRVMNGWGPRSPTLSPVPTVSTDLESESPKSPSHYAPPLVSAILGTPGKSIYYSTLSFIAYAWGPIVHT